MKDNRSIQERHREVFQVILDFVQEFLGMDAKTFLALSPSERKKAFTKASERRKKVSFQEASAKKEAGFHPTIEVLDE